MSLFAKIDDKILHVWAGMLISIGTGLIAYFVTKDISDSLLTGLISTVVIGSGKELIYDKLLKRGVPSWPDFWNTMWGLLVGLIILFMIIMTLKFN